MGRFAVILPAAGKSTRFRDREKKPFVNLDGRAIWLRAAELFVARADVVQTLIVIDPEDEETFRRRYGANLAFMNVQIVQGGKERFESVANALEKLSDEAEYVAVHDAVRPCLTEALVTEVFGRAVQMGAAMLGVPVADTLKQVDAGHRVTGTVSRKGLWLCRPRRCSGETGCWRRTASARTCRETSPTMPSWWRRRVTRCTWWKGRPRTSRSRPRRTWRWRKRS